MVRHDTGEETEEGKFKGLGGRGVVINALLSARAMPPAVSFCVECGLAAAHTLGLGADFLHVPRCALGPDILVCTA